MVEAELVATRNPPAGNAWLAAAFSPRVARRWLGPAVLGWVAVLALLSMRVQGAGPDWRIELVEASGRETAAVSYVDPHGAAWASGVRAGHLVVRVGDEPGRALLGRPVPPLAPLIFVDARGAQRVLAPVLPQTVLLALFTAAFLYAGLGALVFRWAIDARLGGLFLLFGGSFGAGLASIPFGLMGYTWSELFIGGSWGLSPRPRSRCSHCTSRPGCVGRA